MTDTWLVAEVNKNLFSVLSAQDRKQNSEFRSTVIEFWFKLNDQVVLNGTCTIFSIFFKAIIEPIMRKQILETNNNEKNYSLLQFYLERWGHQDKCHIK